jgi:SAM-dependent methyltransferase
VCGDARDLPFPDASFQSVLSISALEHIASPEQAVAEAFRVLVPGGLFLATVVLADLHEFLFFPRCFRRLGLPGLARTYIRCHDRLFRHHTLLPQREWEAIVGRSGFEILTGRTVVGPDLTGWWDFLLLTAWPYRLGQSLGRSFVWHPRWFRNWVREQFHPLLEREESRGSVWAVVARKPLDADADALPISSPRDQLLTVSGV